MNDSSLTFVFHQLFQSKGYVEEGDPCGEITCTGTMELGPVENCTCFVHPPCWRCMDNHPACNQCGWQDPDWERP